MSRMKIASTVLKVLALLAIVVGIPSYIYFFQHDILEEYASIDAINQLLADHRKESILVYLCVQILQIIISIIPGQAVQAAAGYAFGFWLGLLLTLAGVSIGTFCSFYIAKFLGRDALRMIISDDSLNEWTYRLNSKRGIAVIFLIYLIPGIPKDVVTYAAGISEVEFRAFFTTSIIGRLPGMIGCIIIGGRVVAGSYLTAIIILIAAVVLFIAGLIFKNKILMFFDKYYEHIKK